MTVVQLARASPAHRRRERRSAQRTTCSSGLAKQSSLSQPTNHGPGPSRAGGSCRCECIAGEGRGGSSVDQTGFLYAGSDLILYALARNRSVDTTNSHD